MPRKPFHLLYVLAVVLVGCRSKPAPSTYARELPNQVLVHDVTFHSQALSRDETYRVMARTPLAPGVPIHVVYLLHGNAADYRSWSDSTNLAPYAARNFVFIMPEGHSAYWVNSATNPHDQYEDFLTHDLIADAERNLPAHDRSIAGVSMGGFGALTVALHHPGLYVVAGALSPPVDYLHRRFSWHRPAQWYQTRSIFGPYASPQRTAQDPQHLITTTSTPYIYLGEGREPLAEPITRFDQSLTRNHYPHTFQTQPGGHDWSQWNLHLPALFATIESPPQPSLKAPAKP